MDEKVIVITGASAGIGAALARLLGLKGHQTILAARREELLKEVAEQAGSGAIAVKTDVTKRAEVEHLKEVAFKECGRVDVWVNNAGRGISRSVLDLSDSDIDQIINVNLKSAIYGMQTIVPYFQEVGRGHLINISSFLGRVPFVTIRSIYNAAKAGLNMLTANLRMEMRQKYPDIHVSLVMPGVVLTDFAKNAIGGTPGWNPGGRGGQMNAQTPEEVAKSIYSVMENPKAETYTNPATPEIARRYYEDVEAFEKNMLKRE
jgi:NADP-dependent 3-hydroxy acid dehydrogenase YdfG